MIHFLRILAAILGLLAPVPPIFIVIDYGIVRTFARKNGRRKYDPFWWTGIGMAFFLISLALVLVTVVDLVAFFSGVKSLLTAIVAVVCYAIGLGATIFMVIIYSIEKRHPWVALAPKRFRDEQRRLIEKLRAAGDITIDHGPDSGSIPVQMPPQT